MTTKKTRREFTDEFQREAVVLLQDSCSGLHSSAAGRGLMGLIWLTLSGGHAKERAGKHASGVNC